MGSTKDNGDQEVTRLSRLTAILTHLMGGRLVTAAALGRRFGVSVRTIYRDMRALEAAGVPISVEEGKGYGLVEGYRLPPIMFTEEEAYAIITSEQIIRRNKDSSLKSGFSSAVAKVKAVLDGSNQARTELLSERMYINKNPRANETSSALLQLQYALTNHRVVRLDYEGREGKASTRDVEPFAVYNSLEEDWTLVAYCRMREEFRSFRLDRMHRVQMGTEEFAPHRLTLEEYAEKIMRRNNP